VQTRNVFDAIAAMLAELGTDMSQVVRATVWLSDMSLFSHLNPAYAEYFKRSLLARSTVGATLTSAVDFEIEVAVFPPQ
jgi:2-iminobutanoate/2-iminopropanoate deaminase